MILQMIRSVCRENNLHASIVPRGRVHSPTAKAVVLCAGHHIESRSEFTPNSITTDPDSTREQGKIDTFTQLAAIHPENAHIIRSNRDVVDEIFGTDTDC